MSGNREEERRKLADIINHWNANRLDLFEISRPTEVRDRRPAAGEAAEPPRASLEPGVVLRGRLEAKSPCWFTAARLLLWAAWWSMYWLSG